MLPRDVDGSVNLSAPGMTMCKQGAVACTILFGFIMPSGKEESKAVPVFKKLWNLGKTIHQIGFKTVCLSPFGHLKQNHHSRDGKSKIKAPTDPVSGETHFLSSWMAIFLVCPHLVRRGQGPLWDPFYKGTNPITRAPPP